MGALDGLLNQVKDAITQHTSDPKSFDPGKLLGHVTDLFGKHAQNNPQSPKPASQDPYGDPADQERGGANRNIKPASADPYGDPAESRH